jgi:succinyldiaminopimelate transaminase
VTTTEGFTPPPYPYDRLEDLRVVADRHDGGCVDLSVGTPTDPPPAAVVRALASSDTERGYPPSIGTVAFREAAAGWVGARFGVDLDPNHLAACIGTKEFVAGVPHWLRLRRPERDLVLYPAISYPSYAMGATLAGAATVAVPVDASFRVDLGAIDEGDAARALCLWVNTPGNPAGGLDDLGAAAEWGRAHGVPVLSDECYAEYTWTGEPHTILEHGLDGVLAVHSLSKRSNLAGARVGFYAGDPDLVRYLSEVRKHAGFMVPGPVQAAAVAAWGDTMHVDQQRERYWHRLVRCRELLAQIGVVAPLPGGGFYLWAPAPDGDAWALARMLAERAGMLVSPGEFYGESGSGYVRIAMVQPDDRLDLVAARLAASG